MQIKLLYKYKHIVLFLRKDKVSKPNTKKENLLSSWKEIAVYLNVGIRTCHRYEKNFGMPVHRLDSSPRARVFAYKEDLDDWQKEMFRRQSDSFIKKKSIKYSTLLLFIFTLLSLTVLYYIFFIRRTTYSPFDFNIKYSTLTILDEKGNDLWSKDLGIENLIDDAEYHDHFQTKRLSGMKRNLPFIIMKDINGDGFREVLFSIKTQDGYNEGKLYCFNHKGDNLWEFSSGRNIKYGTTPYSSDFRIQGIDLFDLNNDGELEIVVISFQHPFFPTQFSVLNNNGELINEYWHAGRLMDYEIEDIDGDRLPELILVGCNNEYNKGCIIVFDTENIKGSSPQSKDDYICEGLETGYEKYYILMPVTDVLLTETIRGSTNIVQILKNKRIEVVTILTRIYYEFDFNLNLTDIRPSDDFRIKHRDKKAEGIISSTLSEQYFKDLSNGILYYDGKNWIHTPTMIISNTKTQSISMDNGNN